MNKRKKILVDTVSGKEGGIKTLIKNYAYYFNKYAQEFDFTFYVSPQIYDDAKLLEANNVKIKKLVFFARKTYLRVFWELFILPFILLKYDCLYSITHIFPLLSNKPGVLLIHQPNFFVEGYFQISKYYIFLVKLSCKKASYVLTQTNFIKQKVIDKFNIQENKVKILPQGLSFELLENRQPDNDIKNIFNKLQNENKIIILFISGYSKHKNFEKLIESIGCLSNEEKSKVHLLLTIDTNFWDKLYKNTVEEKYLQEAITNLGTISSKNIAYLYKNTDMFIFPSILETLGLPLIEAMSFGLPILASDLEYAHDVCDDAVVYFNPNNAEDIAEKIKMLLNDKNKAKELSDKSIQRAKTFCWKTHVDSLLGLLN